MVKWWTIGVVGAIGCAVSDAEGPQPRPEAEGLAHEEGAVPLESAPAGEEEGEEQAQIVKDMHLKHRSDLYASVRSIAMTVDGRSAVMGMMSGNTCSGDLRSGSIGLDEEDFDRDEPDDPRDRDEDERLLVRTGEGAVLQGPTGGTHHFSIPGLIDLALSLDGFVSLSGDAGACALTHHSEAEAIELVDSELCSGRARLVADRATDTTYVAGGSLWAFQPDGTHSLLADDAGDLLALANGVLVHAWSGSTTVGAVDVDGVPLWEIEVGLPVRDVVAVGGTGAVAIVTSDGSYGMLEAVGVFDGASWMEQPLMTADARVYASADGSTVAMVSAGQSRIGVYEVKLRDVE